MSSPTDPVALITGSGRKRVGQVVARHLAHRGYRIALHYRSSEEEAIQARDEIRTLGHDCEAYQADVACAEEVERMVSRTHERFGRIDVLVTTASVWGETPLHEVTPDQLRSYFDINTLGTFFAARAAGRVMVDQPEGGAIVTIGDWSIDRPYPDYAAYFISKGAIPTLTRLLACELAQQNPRVRVNCLHPGPVMFPPDATEERKQRLIEATLVKRADCPDEVAKAVQALIEMQYVTGACLPVDGGRHMFSPGEI